MSALAGGCKKNAQPAMQHNVILISIDSLRHDHLGCYGYDRPTSPRLDALAKQGILFRHAYSPSPWTLPSHASLFTGLYPETHQINQGNAKLGDNAVTLAEVMKEQGYHTAAIVCAPLLRKRYRLDQGFDIYDTKLVAKTYRKARRVKVAEKVTKKALKYIDDRPSQPFFMFLHYWDPHYDYNPAPQYVNIFDPGYDGEIDGLLIRKREDIVPGMNERDLRHIVALYDGEIRFTDEYFGELLDGLNERGLSENTMIIVTADHGEEFLDHGGTGHTTTCYEELIRVPVIAYVPWRERTQSVVEDHVSLLDVFPTILDILGISAEGIRLQGRTLTEAMYENESLGNRHLMAETRGGRIGQNGPKGRWVSMLSPEGMKYHEFRGGQDLTMLFDLNRDAGEMNNLADVREEIRQQMERQLELRRKINRKMRKKLHVGREEELDPELAETLKGLGYMQ